MTDDVKKILNELPNTQYGQALDIFLGEEYDKIRDVRGIRTLEETIGRQKALEVLDKLFGFMRKDNLKKPSKNQYE